MEHLFSIAVRDELWSGGALVESRASHGRARCRDRAIEANDVADPVLIERAEARMSAMRAIAREMRDARVRLVASSRRVNEHERDEATMSVTINGVSFVVSPSQPFPSPRPAGRGVRSEGLALPIVWKNGSASVLLHEAAGHASEHAHASLRWPHWLSVHDEPDFAFDDTGAPTRAVDLTKEPPATLRRESFRDAPLPRMTRLVARQHGAPWSLPEERVEVHFVAGGAYEPLTGMVTISIAVADVVRGDRVEAAAPFHVRLPRKRVAESLAGAMGEPVQYPGVVCSREGQEVVVGSFAPLMVTR